MAVGVTTVTIVACRFSLEKGLSWIRDMEHLPLPPQRSRKYILRGWAYQKARKAWKVDWSVCSRACSSSQPEII